MSDPRSRYKVTGGIDRDSLPWRLWMKAKKNFWDPADIDYSQDKRDWETMPEELKVGVAIGARGFMVGEEAVTLDILPLVRAISDEGRLEETIFLTSFALEEAKHVDFFREWFDAVGFDPGSAPQVGGYSQGGGADIFGVELQRVMTRLDNDRSPEAFLDCGITYNQFIEGCLAIAGSQELIVYMPTRVPRSPIDPKWDYPQSKVRTEELIRAERGSVPAVLLRIAGVYDDRCHSIPLAHQIQRIFERLLRLAPDVAPSIFPLRSARPSSSVCAVVTTVMSMPLTASTLSSARPLAETTMIGTRLHPRSSRTTSIPSLSGSPRSRITKSGLWLLAS